MARTLAATPCDVLLLDLQMDRNALADIASFARRVQVVVVTASQDPAEALAAIRAGARAVVFKRFAVETLVEALRTVREGHVWLPPALQSELTARLTEPDAKALTSREREIVRLVALGFQNSEIAQRLEIGDATVKTHLNNVFHKLEVRDRVALTLYAIRLGLVGITRRRSSRGVCAERRCSANMHCRPDAQRRRRRQGSSPPMGTARLHPRGSCVQPGGWSGTGVADWRRRTPDRRACRTSVGNAGHRRCLN